MHAELRVCNKVPLYTSVDNLYCASIVLNGWGYNPPNVESSYLVVPKNFILEELSHLMSCAPSHRSDLRQAE